LLIGHMLEQDGVRLPGARRHQASKRAREDGVDIPAALVAELEQLAA
jgi:(2R)-3-sulfolactate dehydrogenase (NADP+)